MNHQQNGSSPRLDGDSAERMPTQLAGIVDAVWADEAVLILKDQGRELE